MHAKWGRWLIQDRLSLDQVPCNFVEGDPRTYEFKGANRVHVRGTKADSGKRFCTLQILCRGTNDHGQPLIAVIFRGQGKRISQEERQQWNKKVLVYFQGKAWVDQEFTEKYVGGKDWNLGKCAMEEATREARTNRRESVVLTDNLHSQTTARVKKLLAKWWCRRHLLVGGATDLLQLIDDGVGFHVKNEMGKLLDLWLTKDDNLELWMSEDGGFPMWKKRVLITDLLAQAWENVCDGNEATECKAFDFLASATRIGHNMTIDGSNDAQIHLSGIANYSFSDKDGGEPGDDSELEWGAQRKGEVRCRRCCRRGAGGGGGGRGAME